MALAQGITFTSEDYWNLPEGKRAELIDGEMYDMAAPLRIHQELVYQLGRNIGNFIADHHGDCKVYPAPFAVNLQGDDRIWVEPDISVICDKSKLSDRGCEGAPDWIIEITSPSTQQKDYGIKLYKYRISGVREYWIINPNRQTVNVFDFEHNEHDSNLYSFDDDIPVGIYPGFTIKIAALLQ